MCFSLCLNDSKFSVVIHRTDSRCDSQDDQLQWFTGLPVAVTQHCSQVYQLEWFTGLPVGVTHMSTSWSDSHVYLLEWLTCLLVGVTHRSISWSDLQVYQLEWLTGLPVGVTHRSASWSDSEQKDYQLEGLGETTKWRNSTHWQISNIMLFLYNGCLQYSQYAAFNQFNSIRLFDTYT